MRLGRKKSGKISAPLTKCLQGLSVIKIIKEYETNLLKKNFKDLENALKYKKTAKFNEKKRENWRK